MSEAAVWKETVLIISCGLFVVWLFALALRWLLGGKSAGSKVVFKVSGPGSNKKTKHKWGDQGICDNCGLIKRTATDREENVRTVYSLLGKVYCPIPNCPPLPGDSLFND